MNGPGINNKMPEKDSKKKVEGLGQFVEDNVYLFHVISI